VITEVFLNACFSLVLNEAVNVKKNRALYNDVLDILTFHENKDKIDIPLNIKNKFDCLKKICQMKKEGKTSISIIDSITDTEKFMQLSDFMMHKSEEEVQEEDVVDYVKQIRLRKKLNSLFSNYDQLTDFLDQLKDGSFESIDDIVIDYEEIVRTLYTNMMEENRGTAIEASSSLDLVKDDYDSVLELIQKKYSRENTIPTGFQVLDNEIFRGGLEPSRLYILAGSSGSGKSTLLNNIMVNAATTSPMSITSPIKEKKEGTNEVHVFITLENTIEESLLRCYQYAFGKTTVQALSDVTNGVNIKELFVDKMKANGSTIIMKYFPAYSISTLDIMSVFDDVISEYGPDALKCGYVDYLDLLRADVQYDQYRLELGHITMSLKTAAVTYNIPIVVPTQLGRGAYRAQDSSHLNLDQIAEAIKKVDHADFVSMQCKAPTNDKLVYMKIGKNRMGKADVSLNWNVDFEKYTFIRGSKVSNAQKADAIGTGTSQLITDFSGLKL